MGKSSDRILQELEVERIRRQSLTRSDLQRMYAELRGAGFPLKGRIDFICDLGGSNEVEYHYELICNDWETGGQLHLDNSFDKHDLDGLDFLFSAIGNTPDERVRIFTAYLIAEILTRSKHRDFYKPKCSQLIPILTTHLDIPDHILRRKVLIALGWVGSTDELAHLCDHMLHDEDRLCRAWSASSLWQLLANEGQADGSIPLEVCEAIGHAISAEIDPFACGVMIESAQALFNKRWVSSSAVENRDTERIEKARKSATRFLTRLQK